MGKIEIIALSNLLNSAGWKFFFFAPFKSHRVSVSPFESKMDEMNESVHDKEDFDRSFYEISDLRFIHKKISFCIIKHTQFSCIQHSPKN
jgi:hypothetical protein